MKRQYSKKERQTRKLIINTIIGLLVLVAIIFAIYLFTSNGENSGPYTAEELLHDHDGDGIPDH